MAKKIPTKFMVQATVRYSDDAGQSLERSINLSEEQTYQDFMDSMAKIYEQVRFTFGPKEFDDLYKEPEAIPEGEVAEDTDTETQEKDND